MCRSASPPSCIRLPTRTNHGHNGLWPKTCIQVSQCLGFVLFILGQHFMLTYACRRMSDSVWYIPAPGVSHARQGRHLYFRRKRSPGFGHGQLALGQGALLPAIHVAHETVMQGVVQSSCPLALLGCGAREIRLLHPIPL